MTDWFQRSVAGWCTVCGREVAYEDGITAEEMLTPKGEWCKKGCVGWKLDHDQTTATASLKKLVKIGKIAGRL